MVSPVSRLFPGVFFDFHKTSKYVLKSADRAGPNSFFIFRSDLGKNLRRYSRKPTRDLYEEEFLEVKVSIHEVYIRFFNAGLL